MLRLGVEHINLIAISALERALRSLILHVRHSERSFRTLGVCLVHAADTPRGEEGGKPVGTSDVKPPRKLPVLNRLDADS